MKREEVMDFSYEKSETVISTNLLPLFPIPLWLLHKVAASHQLLYQRKNNKDCTVKACSAEKRWGSLRKSLVRFPIWFPASCLRSVWLFCDFPLSFWFIWSRCRFSGRRWCSGNGWTLEVTTQNSVPMKAKMMRKVTRLWWVSSFSSSSCFED